MPHNLVSYCGEVILAQFPRLRVDAHRHLISAPNLLFIFLSPIFLSSSSHFSIVHSARNQDKDVRRPWPLRRSLLSKRSSVAHCGNGVNDW
jgi:hypothetical protein